MSAVQLTMRELQALQLLANGHSTKDAARQMGLSVHTLKDHTDRMRLKLAARNNTHAAVIAVRQGLL